MKYIYYSIVSLVVIIGLYSCNDFLKEQSQDEIKPSSLEDLESVMYSDAYPYQYSSDVYLNLLTDDYQSNGLLNSNYTTVYKNGSAIFQWNPKMFDGTENFLTDMDSWKNYYKLIDGCNVVKDYLSKVSGTEKEKNAVLGQVLFLRAYYYMKLVMIYGQPYNGKNIDPDKSLGVPLILKMDVSDEFPVRNTLREVYNQIESDFLMADSLLQENYVPTSVFRVGASTVDAMLSRFYLYRGAEGDNQKVIEYADKAIAEGPKLVDLYSFKSSFGTNGIYDPNVSDEAFWIYGYPELLNSDYYMETTYGQILPYTLSDDLMSLYDDEDLRKSSYFYSALDYTTNQNYTFASNKVGTSHSTYGERGIRIAEVYLNRAEASSRLYQSTGKSSYRDDALSDLNKLRLSRYDKDTYVPVVIDNADSLLNFCLEERRRELCLEEGLRWFDIKRLGLSLTHKFIDNNNVETDYVLSSEDLRYALPIPYTAIERNYKLVQNPR